MSVKKNDGESKIRERVQEVFLKTSKNFPIKNYFQSMSRIQIEEICISIDRHLGKFQGKRLLDVGSGPMDKTAVLAGMGFDCFAADDLSDPWHKLGTITEDILNFGKSHGVKFHLQTADDYTIPFENGSFDIVLSVAVIEHLHDTPRHIMNAMGDKLKTGGILVIQMPNSVNLRKRMSVLRGRTNYNPLGELFYSIGGYRGHVREYTLSETVQLCEWSGFELVEARTFEHLAQEKLKGLPRWLYTQAGNLIPSLRSGLMVVCRKPDDWSAKEEDPTSYFKSIGSSLPGSAEFITRSSR